jgi:nucleosome assembly protein 1-like 1
VAIYQTDHDLPDTKQTRVVKISVPTESFFNFFSPPQPPTEDDESVASDIEERLELDYQLGEDIKEKLIPRAIDWFTGEALQFEELGEDMEGDEFEDEDDDEEDDDEEDDEDEDDRGSDRDVEEDSDEEVRNISLSQASSNANQFQDGASKPKKEAAECKQN